jgi:Pro-kumamolisin, activation domain/Bacterial Ig-like domain (group 3)
MERWMRFWKFVLPLLASTLCFGAQPDRITGPVDSSQMVALSGNVHELAQPRFDLGRTDGARLIYGVTLAFRLSAAQQQDLNNLLAQQQDRSSPNYHKWLTPAQFGARFGMTQNDINRVVAWLESEGFTVTSISNSRNQIAFDGTVAQIESAFRTEIHNYLVESEVHFANATNPSVPAAFASSVLNVGHLHSFSPKPRAKFQRMSSASADPHFTSALSGNHFLAPGDFATIYDLPAGLDGTGQTIAIIGQSTVNPTDLSNFRSAALLPAKAPQLILVPSNSTAERCSGDEGESDLDLEWSGGVAKNANIIFVYAGLVGIDTCNGRNNSVWNALQETVDKDYAPIISTSYGSCESSNGEGFADEVRGWAQQANAQGQTIMAASGDAGAADCDGEVASATLGLAVDVPAAIPEVTGMGGTEFLGDDETTVTNGNAAPDPPYWSGTTGGTDAISSALTHIPEIAWNDTVEAELLSASGGGASLYFAKPTWQTGTGVPSDGKRDVPDLALNASPNHDGYLICSEDGPGGTVVATCTSGFRTAGSAEAPLTVIGGTSCAAPTFAAVTALLNESLGSSGLGNINPTLYALASSNPTAFHDVITGSNIVPCTEGSTSCPATAPFQFGFSAGVGYDQVTGLGSVDASALFTAWGASLTASSITISTSATSLNAGASVTFTVTVTPATGVGSVSFSTLNNGTTTALGTTTLNIPYPPSKNGTATFTTTSLPGGSNSVTATYQGDASDKASTSLPTIVTVADFALQITTALTPSSISAGQFATAVLTIAPVNGSTQTVNFTNSTSSAPGSCTAGLPAGALCSFTPSSVTLNGTASQTVTLTVTTAANMAATSGVQTITVTGTSSGTGGTSHAAIPSPTLTVTATAETFSLVTTNSVVTYPVAVGGSVQVGVTVNSTTGFIVGTGTSPTTALPLTYTCTGTPSLSTAEIACQFSPTNGQSVSATSVTLTLVTTPATAKLHPPLGGSRIFYALLLPGLFGIVLAAGSRARGLRLLCLIAVLGFSTLWLGSCSGSGGGGTTIPPNPGTPPATYIVTISATTGGAVPVVNSNAPFTINLNVTQ